MIQGSTIFLGDSITVGLSGHVPVAGERAEIAGVGRTSGWLLEKVRGLASSPTAGGYRNAFVLIGTNDVGGDATPEAILRNVQAIWQTLASAGVRVFAATIPPFKGYEGYASRFDAIEKKRQAVNAGIAASTLPYKVVRLDLLMADPSDRQRLSSHFDIGDHLHPKKGPLAGLLDAEMSGPTAPLQLPASSKTSSSVPAFLVLAIGVGAGYALVRAARKGKASRVRVV